MKLPAPSTRMDFRILGPLEVLDEDQPISLGGSKRRAVLALLLLHANETVGADRLIDELWGEQPPATAGKTLQVHVSRLRKELTGDVLVTRGSGYELVVDPEDLDAHRFEARFGEGRSELADGRPEHALEALEDALSLWRGPALADLAYEPFAQPEVARLEDLRAAANEQLIEAKLALGRQAEVIAPLETLIEEHPYRERLRAQLMLALYRADRQADALQAYQNARTRLVEELGIEPGERLRELERAILAQDPALAQPAPKRPEPAPEAAPPEPPSDAPAEPPADLPSGVVTFVLTDIQGSSGMWEADFHAMAAALEEHDGLVARIADAHDGSLLKTKGEGDSTLTVFPRASDAVAAAAELHTLLAEVEWPLGPGPRVRVAVYTGEAHERDGDYFGPALNRAARLRSLAHAGAALVSQATAEIVRDRLPPGTGLVELGRRELRGLARPEHVFELRTDAAGDGGADARRKTVTVLFACLLDLEPEGEGLDAEARRRVSDRCLEDMRGVLERHGGTVEAYPGDALMAVYGVPRLHEDDAVRAVRAAVELGEGIDTLGDEFGRALGLRPRVRIGVGTGEVIAETGTAAPPAPAGDAVNVAKRLEERAGAGEILLDERTHLLVRGFAETEPLTEPESAVRLLDLRPDGERPRGLESPLVGRAAQIEALARAFDTAVAARTCHLVTVLGAAGVGKSRLVEEFTSGLGDAATVVGGRCLPYGEGITFWPLAEIVGGLPEPLADQLADDPQAEAIAEVVSEAVGHGGSTGATSEKIFWAARRLFEAMARRRPLVVVVDDLQWAEATFLDLVEHVADLARDAPIVVLCMARAELLDARPGWGGGKLNAASIHLDALGTDDTRELVANLLGQATLPREPADRLAATCEGNPLFAEELLSMLIDEGRLRREQDAWALSGDAGRMPIPPTIQSLLGARLEQLPDDERALLGADGRGRELFPAGRGVRARARVARAGGGPLPHGARPARPDPPRQGEHAPGRGVPLPPHPDPRRRLWLAPQGGARRAARALRGLDRAVGGRPAHRDRGDPRLPPRAGPPLRRGAGPSGRGHPGPGGARLGPARVGGAARARPRRRDRGGQAARASGGARGRPRHAAGDAPARPRRRADRGGPAGGRGRGAGRRGPNRGGRRRRAPPRPTRSSSGSSSGSSGASPTAPARWRRWWTRCSRCSAAPVTRTGSRPRCACAPGATGSRAAPKRPRRRGTRPRRTPRSAGAEHERTETLLWIASSLFFGPAPVAGAIRRCEAIRADVEGNLAAVAEVLQPLAGLHAMEGRFDRARELLGSSEAAFEELGLTLNSAVSHHAATVELLAGDPAAAERTLRKGYATLEEMGDRALLSTTAAFLGQALLAQGSGGRGRGARGHERGAGGRRRPDHAGHVARSPGARRAPARPRRGGRRPRPRGRGAREPNRLREPPG